MKQDLIQTYDMLPSGGTVLCAVSGGADSMCLLAWLLELGPKYGCAVRRPITTMACAAHRAMLTRRLCAMVRWAQRAVLRWPRRCSFGGERARLVH